jgi:hypothetical protein
MVPPNEVTPTKHMHNARTTMSVQGNDGPRRNEGVKNAHALVFEQTLVVGRGGDQGIHRIGPVPRFHSRGRNMLAQSSPPEW